MEYYIFQAARQYYAENTTDQTGSKIDSYDWDQTAADGRKGTITAKFKWIQRNIKTDLGK